MEEDVRDDKYDEMEGQGICIADECNAEEESCGAIQELHVAVSAADEDTAGEPKNRQVR